MSDFASQFISLRAGVVESLKLLEFESEVTIQSSMSVVCLCVSSSHELGIEIDHRGAGLGEEVHNICQPLLCGN